MIIKNMKVAFGFQSEGLSKRFYYFLANNFELQRIYINDYAIKLLPLAEGGFIERNYFAFQLLDGDRDGAISALDLIEIDKELL